MATQYELYYETLSQPSRSCLMALKLVNAPYKLHMVDLEEDEHKKPEFLKLNPFHAVPVLVHGDFILTESVAIARYILNTNKHDDHWYPSDPKKRARVDEYLAYQHTAIRKAGVDVCIKFVFNTLVYGKPATEEEKQAALKTFDEVLKGFEGYFLKNGPFIAGEEVSIADIFAVSEIVQSSMSGKDCISDYPKIKAWVERTKAELQPHYDEVFSPLADYVKEHCQN